jgi:hypothetical protein
MPEPELSRTRPTGGDVDTDRISAHCQRRAQPQWSARRSCGYRNRSEPAITTVQDGYQPVEPRWDANLGHNRCC